MLSARAVAALALLAPAACTFDPSASGAPAATTDASARSDGEPFTRPDATPTADAAPPLLRHDFESSTAGPFTGVYTWTAGDRVERTTEVASTGEFAGRFATDSTPMNQASLFVDIEPQPRLYAAADLRLPTAPTTSVMIMSASNAEDSWINIAELWLRSDLHLEIVNPNVPGSERFLSTSPVSEGTWHRVELEVSGSPSAGEYRLWLDGVEQVSESGLNTGSVPIIRFLIGIPWQANHSAPQELFFDDIVVAERR